MIDTILCILILVGVMVLYVLGGVAAWAIGLVIFLMAGELATRGTKQ